MTETTETLKATVIADTVAGRSVKRLGVGHPDYPMIMPDLVGATRYDAKHDPCFDASCVGVRHRSAINVKLAPDNGQ